MSINKLLARKDLQDATRNFAKATAASRKHSNLTRNALEKYGDHGSQISGVIRDHFPKDVKDELRRLARDVTEYSDAGYEARPKGVRLTTMRELASEVARRDGSGFYGPKARKKNPKDNDRVFYAANAVYSVEFNGNGWYVYRNDNYGTHVEHFAGPGDSGNKSAKEYLKALKKFTAKSPAKNPTKKKTTRKKNPARGSQHWIATVRDTVNNQIPATSYFDGTMTQAKKWFKRDRVIKEYWSRPGYVITMQPNSIILWDGYISKNPARKKNPVEAKAEKYASGKYDVITTGDYPRRLGNITGAKTTWLAEIGPVSLGYFKTKKAAVQAIIDETNLTKNPARKKTAHKKNPATKFSIWKVVNGKTTGLATSYLFSSKASAQKFCREKLDNRRTYAIVDRKLTSVGVNKLLAGKA